MVLTGAGVISWRLGCGQPRVFRRFIGRIAAQPLANKRSATVTTKTLSPQQMEARVSRFDKLQTYQTQNFEAHGIPPGAVEKITARRVYPVMAPADYQGRSAGAPVKGPRGLIVSIAECEPGNGPGLHRHLNTVENFMCLSGRFEIAWGDHGEHSLVLDPLEMISVTRGENRSFRNLSNETGRLLVMIVPETAEQSDPIAYAPSLAKEIERQYGKSALQGLEKIGFKFEDEPAA
jgi:mannose-6-phosphate isomerase-like protein (cupin superfamily)